METVEGERLWLERRNDKDFMENINRDFRKMDDINTIVKLMKDVNPETREKYGYSFMKNLVEGKL